MYTFADDTTVVGSGSGLCNNKSAYRNEVLSLVDSCCLYNLELNVSKTKELVVDLALPPLTINGLEVESVDRDDNSICIIKKAHQRLIFLFGVSRGDAAVVQSCDRKWSHLFYVCVVWQLHSSADEAAGQNCSLCLKNHQLQTHPHLWHLRDPHSAQRSKNTTRLHAPCKPPLTNSPQEQDSGPSKRRHPISSTALQNHPIRKWLPNFASALYESKTLINSVFKNTWHFILILH